MFKRSYFVPLVAFVILTLFTANASFATPSVDAQMTQQRIKEVIERYQEVTKKIEQLQEKINVWKSFQSMAAGMLDSITNLSCIEGGAIGKVDVSGGSVMVSTGLSSSGCGAGGAGIGAPALAIDELWGDVDEAVADLSGLETALKNVDGVMPIEVYDQYAAIYLTGAAIAGATPEEKEFNQILVKMNFAKNATLAAMANASKVMSDVATYKKVALDSGSKCSSSASTLPDSVACTTHGITLTMMLEMERTKLISTENIALSSQVLIGK